MSTSFSANQYDNAFTSKKLGNWEVAAIHREKPESLEGFTQIIGTDKGHLLPGLTRSQKNPWGDFVGTWDLPKQIPGNNSRVGTARTKQAQEKLANETQQASQILSGRVKNQARQGIVSKCVTKKPSNAARLQARSGAENPGSKMFGNTESKLQSTSPLEMEMETGRYSGLDNEIQY